MTKKIGIFGGGQLGRMLAQSALPLGIHCDFLEEAPLCPAESIGNVYTQLEYKDFCKRADVFTLEFENTPVAQYRQLSTTQKKSCYPNADVLAVAQDRLAEKAIFEQLGITTVPFSAIYSEDDLQKAVMTLGLPIVLKTCRGGYDGKGQVVIRDATQIHEAWQELGDAVPLIAEGFIDFNREVSIIAVRSRTGDIKTYPLIENHHHTGILSHSIAPAPQQEQLIQPATQAITKLLEHFDYVGVLTLELFVTDTGIIANEIAPRVHNSGHWSIEGAVCSQFENHMRAVAGLPLGSTEITQPSVMINIIGELPISSDVLAVTNAHLHLYNKTERAHRKIGHITLMPCLPEDQEQKILAIKAILPNTMGL